MKIIGLDVGTLRIGVAYADSKIKIPIPLETITVDAKDFHFQKIIEIAKSHQTNYFVIGLPRNLSGLETKQSEISKDFAARLKKYFPKAKIYFQDETLTSVEAENRLGLRAVRNKGLIDQEAAAIILHDFLEHLSTSSKNSEKSKLENKIAELSSVSSVSSVSENLNPHKNLNSNHTVKTLEPNDFTSSIEPINLTLPAQSDQTSQSSQEESHHGSKDHSKKQSSKKNQKAAIKIFLSLFLFLSLTVPIVVFFVIAKTPFNQDSTMRNFTIRSGASFKEVSEQLEQQNFIKSSFIFFNYAKLTNRTAKIQSGTHQLSSSYNADKILQILSSPTKNNQTFRFIIRPGENILIIKARLAKKHGYGTKEIEKAFSASIDHPVLKDKPADSSLEGYLFAETFEFYQSDPLEKIIKTYLDHFEKNIKEHKLEEAFKKQGLNLHQAIILASIVQKEAAPKDQPGVARVFLNRLKDKDFLGSDVTVSYAIDLVDPERKIYTDQQKALAIQSCYNTRSFQKGLPCGPISIPSLSALKAVAYPATSNYRYFLTGDDGKMYYGNTLAEHTSNLKYCKKLCQANL